MTTVPPRPPIPPGRGKRVDPRKYSWQSWTLGYTALVLEFPLYAFLWFLATFVKQLSPQTTAKLLLAHRTYTQTHPMDFRIPPDPMVKAYMHRWWRIARNAYLNIYYHIVLRSDDDRALHDHPWWNFSIVLDGGYFEHEIKEGGIHKRTWYGPGAMRFRWHGKKAHRLELRRIAVTDTDLAKIIEADGADMKKFDGQFTELPVTSIFITGPVLRRWGFHAGEHGWIDAYDWDAFCEANGIKGMKVDGGSDAVQSDRNKL